MPGAAAAICKHPGCNTITTAKDRRCVKHPAPAGAWGASATKRTVVGRHLTNARRALFKEQPICVECERKGFVRLATIRDHIIPVAEGGSDTPDNTQALCKVCHDSKSKAEAARGMQRAREGGAAPAQEEERVVRSYSLA